MWMNSSHYNLWFYTLCALKSSVYIKTTVLVHSAVDFVYSTMI